jgi:hypothetical protein
MYHKTSTRAIPIPSSHSPTKSTPLRYLITQITLAVFDRAIPKLVAAVSNKENTTSTKRDALKTLNELASHQV